MKTAIYIEQGVTQIVLTPESDLERNTIALLSNQKMTLCVRRGNFYECQGGWWRQGAGDDSAIIRLDAQPKQDENPSSSPSTQ